MIRLTKTSNAVVKAPMKPLTVRTTLASIFLGATLLSPTHALGWGQDLTAFLRLIDQSWYELSPQERSRARENYRRFQKLPPEKQRAIEEQYNRWQRLPSEERERIQRNYNRYRDMDSDEKEEFLRKYRQWRSQQR